MSSTNQEPAFRPSRTLNLTNKNSAFGLLYKIRVGLIFVPCQKNQYIPRYRVKYPRPIRNQHFGQAKPGI